MDLLHVPTRDYPQSEKISSYCILPKVIPSNLISNLPVILLMVSRKTLSCVLTMPIPAFITHSSHIIDSVPLLHSYHSTRHLEAYAPLPQIIPLLFVPHVPINARILLDEPINPEDNLIMVGPEQSILQ